MTAVPPTPSSRDQDPPDAGGDTGPLPRNPNGKIDRQLLAAGWVERQAG